MYKKIHIEYFIKYCMVGVVNTVLFNGVVFFLAKTTKIPLEISTAIAMIFSITSHFLCNKFFTFKVHQLSSKEIIRYLSMVTINYLVTNASLKFFMLILHLNLELSLFFTTGIIMVIGFSLSNFWVFRKIAA
jgi:putative flippase GtrA